MRSEALAALVLISFAVTGQAKAASGYWGPIAGFGWAETGPDYQPAFFTTQDGWLSVYYDDTGSSLPTGSITLDTGSAGHMVVADRQISESVSDSTIWFTAYTSNGEFLMAGLAGDPTDTGTWTNARVSAMPGYHGLELTFYGAQVIVPEPSGGLLLALGIAGSALAGAVRRRRKQPGH